PASVSEIERRRGNRLAPFPRNVCTAAWGLAAIAIGGRFRAAANQNRRESEETESVRQARCGLRSQTKRNSGAHALICTLSIFRVCPSCRATGHNQGDVARSPRAA